MDLRGCPVCSATFGPDWWMLSRYAAGDPIATHVCPGCTLAWTGRPWFRTDAGYRARVCSRDAGALLEGDDGRVGPGPTEHRRAIEQARLGDLERAVAAIAGHRRLRVLQIGLRDPSPLLALRRRHRVNAVAIEPWAPWAQTARSHDLDVHQRPLEGWRRRGTFDLIVEHDVLPHLCDPMEHLGAIAGRLAPAGVAVIEVPNLLQAVGSTDEVLTTGRPFWFTPRALTSACKRAGLLPFHLATDERLRVWCRRAAPIASTLPGPSACDVVDTVRGNDLRLQLKRALFRTGATPTAIQMAAAIHARCSHPGVRADLAIEIASACERGSDLESATRWLEASQRDRPDPEVVRTLVAIAQVRRSVEDVWAELPAANGPMPAMQLAS